MVPYQDESQNSGSETASWGLIGKPVLFRYGPAAVTPPFLIVKLSKK